MDGRRIGVRLATAVAVLVAIPTSGGTEPSPATKVVFLVRHAEKATDDPTDPSLTAAGTRRADLLASMLAATGVTGLYSTEYRRTRDTLMPLAAAVGLEVTVVPAREMDRQVRILRDLPAGSVVVVAGHSNTIPALVRALGGDLQGTTPTSHGEMLGDDEHDRLFAVVSRVGRKGGGGSGVQTLELRYGEPARRRP